jgi:hypothetical protein
MPYAAKATIQCEFNVNLLNVWLTFRHPMNQLLMPALNLWTLDLDTVDTPVTSSAWQDEFTLLLVVSPCAAAPARVTLAYAGPSPNLATTWGKQWEPWGPILATDLTATLWKAGMICLWSGSIATIPTGWHLCDGTNGTPDLRNRFIVAAGTTYAPGDSGGNLTHTHALTMYPHAHGLAAGQMISTNYPNGQYHVYTGTSQSTGYMSTVDHKPPYYALAYIMKL